jgi:Fur family transcriptional regulator, ferric uptake regulator
MSQEDISLLRARLAENGYQMSKARQAVFKLLISAEPQTMREILDKAAGSVDRVSVYRNIDVFEKIGIVHRVYIGWKYKLELSDEFVGHHHHLSCLNCGKVIDIGDEKHLEGFISELADKYGFTPRRHQFEVDGYCKNCKDASAKS